jgi:hypothetical protein
MNLYQLGEVLLNNVRVIGFDDHKLDKLETLFVGSHRDIPKNLLGRRVFGVCPSSVEEMIDGRSQPVIEVLVVDGGK